MMGVHSVAMVIHPIYVRKGVPSGTVHIISFHLHSLSPSSSLHLHPLSFILSSPSSPLHLHPLSAFIPTPPSSSLQTLSSFTLHASHRCALATMSIALKIPQPNGVSPDAHTKRMPMTIPPTESIPSRI